MRYGWTLERLEWDRLIKVANGTSWFHVRLAPLYRDSAPENAGVYAICARIPFLTQRPFEVLYNVIYIGKDGSSLRRRFLEHCRVPKQEIAQAKQCFSDNLDYWYTAVDSNYIDNLEACLIECLGPTANLIRGRS